jgi:hypothetical protein
MPQMSAEYAGNSQGATACGASRYPAVLGANAQRCQCESGCARAADISAFRGMQTTISAGAIARYTAVPIRLFPEVEETTA